MEPFEDFNLALVVVNCNRFGSLNPIAPRSPCPWRDQHEIPSPKRNEGGGKPELICLRGG